MACLAFPPCRMFVSILVLCRILEYAVAERSVNLVRNGNFEELGGSFPAGVVVACSSRNQGTVIPHWSVNEGAVEIVSTLLWQMISGSSVYAIHLNGRAGPGAFQTKVLSPFTSGAKYQLTFDIAGSPKGGPSVKRLEVDVSPSKCGPKEVSVPAPQGANSKLLHWRKVQLVFEVHRSRPSSMLTFRSLTRGPHGPLIDNVNLIRLHDDYRDDPILQDRDACESRHEVQDGSSRQSLFVRVRMALEIWIRQRFLRPAKF